MHLTQDKSFIFKSIQFQAKHILKVYCAAHSLNIISIKEKEVWYLKQIVKDMWLKRIIFLLTVNVKLVL
jgi:hypothetical protein